MSEEIICPRCKKATKNIADVRQKSIDGIGIIGVGYECEHCGNKWGHQI